MLSRIVKYIGIVVVVFVLVSMFVVAQDNDLPNDPAVNPAANACYEGGSMEGKCDTLWEWQGGWYLIRYESGLILEEDFPLAYISLIEEAEDVEEVEEVVTTIINPPVTVPTCQLLSGAYYDFSGSSALTGSVTTYSDPSCTTPAGTGNASNGLIYEPSGNLALATGCIPGYLPVPTTNPLLFSCI